MGDRWDLADVTRRAFDWIRSAAVGVDGGLEWLENGVLFDDLYCGTVGVLLRLRRSRGGRFNTMQVSAGARGRLLHLARHGLGTATMPDDGLFSEWAGVAVALHATAFGLITSIPP